MKNNSKLACQQSFPCRNDVAVTQGRAGRELRKALRQELPVMDPNAIARAMLEDMDLGNAMDRMFGARSAQ